MADESRPTDDGRAREDTRRLALRRRRAEKLAKVGRTSIYVMPARSRLFWWSLTGGSGLMLALVVLYASGQSQVFSPGPLATHHASLDTTRAAIGDTSCVQCHTTGRNVVDLKCERCHDPGFTDRLTHPAHAALGIGEATASDLARDRSCATCHRDHLGRDAAMTAVQDGECVACHANVPSLGRHPEFAVVAAAASASAGMKFSHQLHLDERLSKVTQARCAYCHVPTADSRGFEPMTFDRTCAGVGCHTTPAGVLIPPPTGTFQVEAVIAPGALPAFWQRRSLAVGIDPAQRPGRGAVSTLAHRDGWLMANLQRLRQTLDPEGLRVERASLEARLRAFDDGVYARAVGGLDDEALAATIASVTAALDAPDGAGDDRQALDAMAAAAAAIAAQAGGGAVAPGPAAAPDASAASPIDPADVERQKAALLSLLAALDLRLEGDDAAALRAQSAALRDQIQALVAVPGDDAADDIAARQRLEELSTVLRALAAVGGPGRSPAIDVLEDLRRDLAERAAGGLTAADVSRARVQILSALDVIDMSAAPELRSQTAALRRRVISLRDSAARPAEARARRARLLARLQLEQEMRRSTAPATLAASRGPLESPASQKAREDDRNALAYLEQTLPDVTGLDPDDARRVADALMPPCAKCHTPAAGGLSFERVRIDQPLMGFSTFNHAPHVQLRSCESCHAGAATSKAASDVNLPSVATCRECHKPSQVRATCVTCHAYHPHAQYTGR